MLPDDERLINTASRPYLSVRPSLLFLGALVCERIINRLPLTTPQLGTWLATRACALTGN